MEPSCPFATIDEPSCPALHPGGSCAEPEHMAGLVRAKLGQIAAEGGMGAGDIDVVLEPTLPGSVRLALRADGLSGALAHRAGVRAWDGLCSGAKAASTVSICVQSTTS